MLGLLKRTLKSSHRAYQGAQAFLSSASITPTQSPLCIVGAHRSYCQRSLNAASSSMQLFGESNINRASSMWAVAIPRRFASKGLDKGKEEVDTDADADADAEADEMAIDQSREIKKLMEMLSDGQEADKQAGLRTLLDLEEDVATDVNIGELCLDKGRLVHSETINSDTSKTTLYAISPSTSNRYDVYVHGEEARKKFVEEEKLSKPHLANSKVHADISHDLLPPILTELRIVPLVSDSDVQEGIVTQALVQTDPPRPSTPLLPAVCASLTPLALLETPPSDALIIGLASGSAVPAYLQHVMPFCHVDVVENDATRLSFAKRFLSLENIPSSPYVYETFVSSPKEAIDHPLAQSLSTYKGGLDFFAKVDPLAFVEGLFPGHPRASNKEAATLIPKDPSHSLVDRITPVRAYSFVLVDTAMDSGGFDSPNALSCLFDAVAPGGVFVRRFPLPRHSRSRSGWGVDVDAYLSLVSSAFPNVYWSQPSADSLVVVGVRGQRGNLEQVLGSNPKYSHPVGPDTFTDLAVALWEARCMDLSVVEKADGFNHYNPKQDTGKVASKLNSNPDYFLL